MLYNGTALKKVEKGGIAPMEQPARACSPEAFRTVYRLCVRLSRKTRFLPYLCAVHTPDAPRAVQSLLGALHGGEVVSAVCPDLVYVLLLVTAEETAQAVQRGVCRALPRAQVRLQCVRADLSASD